MSYIDEVREQVLKIKKRGRLDEILELAYGSNRPALKNISEVHEFLIKNPRPVARILRIRLNWWEHPHVHVYGISSVLGLLLTGIGMYIAISKTSEYYPVDPLRRQKILDEVARIQKSPLPTGIKEKKDLVLREDIDEEKKPLPKPTIDGFELIEHSVVCDLRGFQKVSSVDQEKKISPVVQHIRQTIINLNGDTKYRLWSHTSGIDVYSQSLTHANRLKVYTSKDRYTVAGYLVRPRVLEFNVSDDPVNSAYTIQVKKTFWNAFQNPDQSWAGILVGLPTRSIQYLIVFPNDKPYLEFEFFANDSNNNRIDLPSETYVLEDPQNRWIWWNINNPTPGNGYNIDWEW